MYDPTKENPVEPFLSINQHQQYQSEYQSASIGIKQHQLESISINPNQSSFQFLDF